MQKIRVVSSVSIYVSIYLLLVTHLCAMNEEEALFFNEEKQISRPLVQKKYKIILNSKNLENKKQKISCFYIPSLTSCFNNIFSYLKKKNNVPSIHSLPKGIICHIADFLDSPDILRLSGTCTRFRQVFNETYWNMFLSKTRKSYSFLTLNTSLSPSSNRKAFFSHLWYTEERIYLAAKLNHPEALMLEQYSVYGAYIGKDQYLLPSGVIKHISGESDKERTEKLREALSKKLKADMRKAERVRKSQEKITQLSLLSNKRWY